MTIVSSAQTGVGRTAARRIPWVWSHAPAARRAATALALALVAVLRCDGAHAQGAPAAAPAAKPDAAPATTEGAPGRASPRGTGRYGESVDHGFFGDLAAPPPPAVQRIQGVRLPDAEPARPAPPAAGASKPAAGSGDPAAVRGKPAATGPPPDSGQAPAATAPVPASPVPAPPSAR